MTAPVPSDIDGPADEAGDLIERLKEAEQVLAMSGWNGDPVWRGMANGASRVCAEAAARLAALQQELDESDRRVGETLRDIEKIRNERDRLIEWRDAKPTGNREQRERQMLKRTEASEALASSLQRRVEELTGALKPFADFASLSSFDKLPNNAPMTVGSGMAAKQVTAGAFKAARAALTPPEQGGKP